LKLCRLRKRLTPIIKPSVKTGDGRKIIITIAFRGGGEQNGEKLDFVPRKETYV
jgi:hypothetical protein